MSFYRPTTNQPQYLRSNNMTPNRRRLSNNNTPIRSSRIQQNRPLIQQSPTFQRSMIGSGMGPASPIKTKPTYNQNPISLRHSRSPIRTPIRTSNAASISPVAVKNPEKSPPRDLIDDFNSANEEAKPEIQDILGMNTKHYMDTNNAILKINKALNDPNRRKIYKRNKHEIKDWQKDVKKIMEKNR